MNMSWRAPSSPLATWSRRRAFLSHLLTSALIVGGFTLLVFLVWYPYPYYLSEDSFIPLRVLVGVDVVLGPLMTLILFRPGKKGLWFDMTVILLIQAGAFIYGAGVIYRERPLYVPFAVDRFVVVAASQVEVAALRDAELANPWYRGPLPVFAELPKDPRERSALMFQALQGGKDVERLPQYYRPLGDHLGEVLALGQPVEVLLKRQPHVRTEVEALLAGRGVAVGETLFLPLDGGIRDMSLLVKRGDGRILGAVDAPPW